MLNIDVLDALVISVKKLLPSVNLDTKNVSIVPRR